MNVRSSTSLQSEPLASAFPLESKVYNQKAIKTIMDLALVEFKKYNELIFYADFSNEDQFFFTKKDSKIFYFVNSEFLYQFGLKAQLNSSELLSRFKTQVVIDTSNQSVLMEAAPKSNYALRSNQTFKFAAYHVLPFSQQPSNFEIGRLQRGNKLIKKFQLGEKLMVNLPHYKDDCIIN